MDQHGQEINNLLATLDKVRAKLQSTREFNACKIASGEE